jgi:hypothetical protein
MTKPKKVQPNPVTAVHTQQFDACVIFWAEVLGLSDWRITVSETRSKRAVMAEVFKIDLEQRSATIRLGTNFGATPVTERSLSELALHECLHIFLHEFKEIVQANVTQDDILSAEHRLINILERRLSDASPLGPRS